MKVERKGKGKREQKGDGRRKKQEALGRNNRLLSFDTTRTT
jgi:hypothetical protein